MKSMTPSELLENCDYAVVRFFHNYDFHYIAGVYGGREHAEKECRSLNIAYSDIYGEDRYEVVEISHDS